MTEFESGTPEELGSGHGESWQEPSCNGGGPPVPSAEELQQLVKRLQSSQYELQLQNDALRRVQCELEARVADRTAVAERREQQLRQLASELTRAEQRERRRLAQVLHDHLQQQLVAVRLKLNAIHRRTQDDHIIHVLGEADTMLSESIDDARGLAYELCPPILHDAGLIAALHWLARWKAEKHGLTVEVQADGSAEPAEESMRILLFQVVRELLFNVVKHARTTHAAVGMLRLGERVQVVVSDEGIGFDPKRLGQSSRHAQGFGLPSVRERLEAIGGNLQIDATPGRGTRVTVWVPCQSLGAETNGHTR